MLKHKVKHSNIWHEQGRTRMQLAKFETSLILNMMYKLNSQTNFFRKGLHVINIEHDTFTSYTKNIFFNLRLLPYFWITTHPRLPPPRKVSPRYIWLQSMEIST